MHPVIVAALVVLSIALWTGGVILGGVVGATGVVVSVVLLTHVGVKVTEPKKVQSQQTEETV